VTGCTGGCYREGTEDWVGIKLGGGGGRRTGERGSGLFNGGEKRNLLLW